MIKLRNVYRVGSLVPGDYTLSDARFLFGLLKERTKAQSISHRKMPTFSEHCAFIDRRLYHRWYVIVKGRTRVGMIYVTMHREIGIHIARKYRGRGFGPEAVSVMIQIVGRPCLANIAPKNTPSERMFKRLGFKKIQHTYELAP